NGLVTLHGKVGSEAEKQKAEAAVRDIHGVANVRNLLQVVPSRRDDTVTASDDQVKDRVERELGKDKAFGDVKVQSLNAGVVPLGGRVDSLGDHLRAGERAARVPGVKRVASEITSPDKVADSEIYSDKPAATADAGGTVGDMWITSAVKMRLMA